MALATSNVNTVTDNFQNWIDKTNELLAAYSTTIVTTAANTEGGITVGNATVNGIFTANSVTVEGNSSFGLRGGNTTVANVLYVTSNVSIGNSSVNTVINSSSITVKSIIANGSSGSSGHALYSNGTGIYWAPSTGGGGSLSTFSTVIDTFTANGTQNTFTLSQPVSSSTSLRVVLDGLTQSMDGDYSLTGQTLTMTTAPILPARRLDAYLLCLCLWFHRLTINPEHMGPVGVYRYKSGQSLE